VHLRIRQEITVSSAGAYIRSQTASGCNGYSLADPKDSRKHRSKAPAISARGPARQYGNHLLPQHGALLEQSRITPEVAEARGYRSVTIKAELGRLGFGARQQIIPTLLMPVHGVNGDVVTYQHRPDEPRIAKGKPLKYETPTGSRMMLDVPPMVRPQIGDPTRPLFITEGVRKADAAVSAGLCCVAVLGVWNWRGTNEHGGKVALPDWEDVALKSRSGIGRDVYVVFDSDVMTKLGVYQALVRLKPFLELRGARCWAVGSSSGS